MTWPLTRRFDPAMVKGEEGLKPLLLRCCWVTSEDGNLETMGLGGAMIQ